MDSNKTKSKPFNNLIFFLSLKLQQVDDQSATPFSIDLAKELVVRKLWEGCNSWTGSLQQGYQPQSATPLAFSTDNAKELIIRKFWVGCNCRTGICNKVSTSKCHSFGFQHWPCERAPHQKTLRGLWRPDSEWAACREEPSPWMSWCRWWNGWTRWWGWMGHLAAEPPSPCCCWCRVTATWSKMSTACTQNQHACYLTQTQTPIVSIIV